jgi:DNA-binding transcriptional ArsR family regulator
MKYLRRITMPNDICASYEPTGATNGLDLHLDEVGSLAEIFKILGDETRVKILYMLSQKELCVCDIAEALKMTMPAISNHLRILRAIRLVSYRKEGRQVFYSLDDNHILQLITIAREHFLEEKE